MSSPWSAERRRWLLLSLALLTLPFLLPRFLPLSDLPQHLAQVRLLDELWAQRPATSDLSLLQTRALAANSFVYLPLFILGHLLPPLVAGKLFVWLLVAAIAVALHRLAALRGRDPAHALVASVFIFSAPFYWGFLNFLSGWPLWLWFVARALQAHERAPPSLRQDVADALLIVWLAWAHIFWMVAAAVATLVIELQAPSWQRLLRRSLLFVPVAIAALIWAPRLAHQRAAAGFDLSPYWEQRWLLLGGLHGAIEPAIEGCVALYVLLALWRTWPLRRRALEWPLFCLGALLLAWVILAPSKYMNTLQFNTRFQPPAMMLLLLALPRPAARWPAWLGAAAVAGFLLATTVVWYRFDRVDCSGLEASLRAGEGCRRSLGIDALPRSARFESRPFIHANAYLQTLYGGETNFSFAQLDSSIVVYRQPRQYGWAPGLEWYPNRLRHRDLAFFDCALVGASDDLQASFAHFSGWTSAITAGNFRLYRRPPGP
jgi:hypothetical protein